MQSNVINWLLEKDQPSIRYFTLLDLLGSSKSNPEVRNAQKSISTTGWAHDILKLQKPAGHWESGRDLYRPKYNATNWRMIVLADLGMNARDQRIRKACELFLKKWFTREGEFRDNEICVAGNLARMLTLCGFGDDPRVKGLFRWIVATQKEDGGWHCFDSESGTLDCWEGLSAFSALPRSKWTKGIKRSVESGVEFYLERGLYKEGTSPYKPWFRFHYPNHYYYDILLGLDVITSLGFKDNRMDGALKMMKTRRLSDGRWAMDTIHPDLGANASYSLNEKAVPFVLEKKGAPSKLITLRALRILARQES